jgi:histidinol-phosphate aminotransferase
MSARAHSREADTMIETAPREEARLGADGERPGALGASYPSEAVPQAHSSTDSEHAPAGPAHGRGAWRGYSVGPAPPPGARRLHLNEYRYGHPPGVVEALWEALDAGRAESLLTQYQTGPDAALAEDLARYVNAPTAQHVLLTAGSDEALRAVLDTCRLRGHTAVLFGVPGYTHFEHYARLAGLELVAYPIGLTTPPEQHEAALRYYADLLAAGCLVYLGSPNNPTGDMWSLAVVVRLAGEYPRSLFLVDEAYVEFASAAEVAGRGHDEELAQETGASWPLVAALNVRSVVPAALAFPNVVVTRTLSKAFGLAALRVGYAVGRPETLELLRKAVSPTAYSPLAAPVARAALRRLDHYYRAAAAAAREGRAAVTALRGLGWWALGTPGNFYLVYVGDAPRAAARLRELGIMARCRGELPGLAGFVRLTAGSAEDSRAVLAAFGALVPPPLAPPQLLYTPKGTIAAIKALMKATLGVLAAAGVQVWAQGGTMLGMFRHRSGLIPGGAVPWDDDGDVAYARGPGGEDPLAALGDAFAAARLTLQRNRTGAYWQAGVNAPGTAISPVHIDIFSYSASGEGGDLRYVLDDERFCEEDPGSPQAHCNTKYAHAELFPLSTAYRFYDLVIPMPAESERVLRRALGDDFMRVARIRAPGGLVELPLEDLTPA